MTAAAHLSSLGNHIELSGIDSIVTTSISFDAITFTIKEVHFSRPDGRKKRLYAGIPSGCAKNAVFVLALAGSDSNGNGAYDLISPPSLPNYQHQFPLQIGRDFGLPFIAVDAPLFGAYSYTPDNPVDPLTDDIAAIAAGRKVLAWSGIHSPSQFIVAGVSWGGIRSTWITAAAANARWCYAAGCQLSKTFDTREMFNPTDWADGYNYSNMLKSGFAYKVRLSFGETDYMLLPGSMDILNDIVAYDSNKFSYVIIPGMGHEINYSDLSSWMVRNGFSLL